MAWTQSDVDRLKAAIAAGVTEVVFADRRVTYPKIQALRDALALAQAEVDAANRTPVPRQRLGYQAGKGL